MTDDTPFPLVRAISVKVTCMIHGASHMTGRPQVFNLGHGKTYQTTGEAVCTACPDDRWLRLEFEVDDESTTQITPEEYGGALMAALSVEFDVPIEPIESIEEAHEENDPEPDAVVARPVVAPPQAVGIPFQRRPL